MSGDLLQKISIPKTQTAPMKRSADKPVSPAVSNPVQTSLPVPQLEYSAALTLSPAETAPVGYIPHSPKGRLVKENIFQATGSTVKSYGQCAKYLYKAAVNGEGTDYSVGKINDLTIRAGSLGIAGILAATKAFPFAKGMEFVGLATWFASMAVWPKVIGAPIKAFYGVDINQKYEDSYGRRKSFYEDPQYLPWDLYRHIDKHGKYNKNAPDYEYLNKIGDKLGVPRNIEDRNTAIQDKMRQVATQGNTLWMLTAGFMTPILSSIVADAVQNPLADGIQKHRVKKAEKALAGFESQLDSVLKTTGNMDAEKIFSSFNLKIDPAFESSFKSVAKPAMNTSEMLAFKEFINTRYKDTEMINAIFKEMEVHYILNDNLIPFDKEESMQKAFMESTNQSVGKFKTKIFDETLAPLDDTLKKVSDFVSKNKGMTVTDETKIEDILRQINRTEGRNLGSTSIGKLSTHKGMTVGELKEALRTKNFAAFGLGFVDKIKGLDRHEINDATRNANYENRKDGLKYFEREAMLQQIDGKIKWNVSEVLWGDPSLTDAQRTEYKTWFASFAHEETKTTAKSLERGILNIEKAKKLFSMLELNKQLEAKVQEYAKVTIMDISESVTASNWNKVPQKYLNAMGFSKKEIAKLSALNSSEAAKVVSTKLFELVNNPSKYDKVIKEMSKYAEGAISKEEKAMLNLIGTAEKPGVIQKIRTLMGKISTSAGFSDIINSALDRHSNGFAQSFQVKVRNTINSMGRPFMALDALSRVDEFVLKQLGSTEADFKKIFETQEGINKFYMFKNSSYEDAKKSFRQFSIDAILENGDINNWTTKFEAALPGNARGAKHSAAIMVDLNQFMYGDVSERTGKLLPAELRKKFASVSYESGFKFATIYNCLLPHSSSPDKVNSSWKFFNSVFSRDVKNLDEAGKTLLLRDISIIDELIEGRRFDLSPKDVDDMKKALKGFKDQMTKFNPNYDVKGATNFFAQKIGAAHSSNSRISLQTGKGVVEFFADAARNMRSRNKWSKLVWGIFGTTVGVSAVSIALMGKKNYFNKDVYAIKGGNNANKK